MVMELPSHENATWIHSGKPEPPWMASLTVWLFRAVSCNSVYIGCKAGPEMSTIAVEISVRSVVRQITAVRGDLP